MRSVVFSRENVEYPIIFNIQVAKAVSDKYGNLTNLTERLAIGDMEATAFVLGKMVEEGVLYQNDLLGKHDKPPPETLIPRMLTYADLKNPELSKALTDALDDFTGGNATSQRLAEMGAEVMENIHSTSPEKRNRKK